MQSLIRFLGALNAAVWVGAAIFFTVAVGPAFFSGEMAAFLSRQQAGQAAEVVVQRYLAVQEWCAALALLHLVVEYLVCGRAIERRTLGLLAALLSLALVGGFWLQPKLHALGEMRSSPTATPAQKAQATATFQALHGAGQAANVLMIAGVLFYFWRLNRPFEGPRFQGFQAVPKLWR